MLLLFFLLFLLLLLSSAAFIIEDCQTHLGEPILFAISVYWGLLDALIVDLTHRT